MKEYNTRDDLENHFEKLIIFSFDNDNIQIDEIDEFNNFQK